MGDATQLADSLVPLYNTDRPLDRRLIDAIRRWNTERPQSAAQAVILASYPIIDQNWTDTRLILIAGSRGRTAGQQCNCQRLFCAPTT